MSVTLPENLTIIEREAFRGCTALTKVNIPQNVISIGVSAFVSCSSLTEVNLPQNMTSIGASAFVGCVDLVRVVLPDRLTQIGKNAFLECINLKEIIIPPGVTSLENKAFENCYSLVTVTIPNSVVSISETTFSGCSSLKEVWYFGDQAQWSGITNAGVLGSQTIHYNAAPAVLTFRTEDDTEYKVTVVKGQQFVLPDWNLTAPAESYFKGWNINGEEYVPGEVFVPGGDTAVMPVWGENTGFSALWNGDGTIDWRVESGVFQGNALVIVSTYDIYGKMLNCSVTAVSNLGVGSQGTEYLNTQVTGFYQVSLLSGNTLAPLAEYWCGANL